MESYKIRYSDELYHHGIKGQKWGLRRYQNEDGSVTPAGRERYYGGDGNKKPGRLSQYTASVKTAKQERKTAGDKAFHLTDKQKETLKTAAVVGVAVAASGLAAYGAIKLSKAMEDKKALDYYEETTKILRNEAYKDANLVNLFSTEKGALQYTQDRLKNHVSNYGSQKAKNMAVDDYVTDIKTMFSSLQNSNAATSQANIRSLKSTKVNLEKDSGSLHKLSDKDETLLNDLIFGIEHDKDWYREIPDLEKLLGK